MTFLELRSISKSYGSTRVLDDVSLSIKERTRTAIVGPSGSGKTTLLRIIAGFEWPDSGIVVLGGQPLVSESASVPAHERRVGIVSQDGALFPHLDVLENIGFALDRRDPQRSKRIEELVEMVGMDRSFLKRKPDQLSGGQQQRVALARALARKPRLMLLDEPFSALDTGLRASTRRAVAALLDAAGVTTILVTHDQVEALSFADQVAVMNGGKIAQAGQPAELYRRPATQMVAEFLGDAVILQANVENGIARCAFGVVKVQDTVRSGSLSIVLRPEQIKLVGSENRSQQIDGAKVRATVMAVEFGGAFCTVQLKISSAGGADVGENAPIHLRVSGLDAPEAGSEVDIETIGLAHVF